MPRRRGRISALAAGVIGIVLIAIGVYFGFSKHVPFTHGFRLNAVFTSANSIRPGSPVRIAGVNVGKVTGSERAGDSNMATVQMQLNDSALPIHRNATAKIRPRTFLEGNFFVDLRPGTPTSPDLSDNDTLAVTQTSTPVQIDQVLTALQSNTRQSLQDVVDGLGKALDTKPTPAEDARQSPSVRGLTGGQAINRSYDRAPRAFQTTSQVSQALLGSQPHDLSRLIEGLSKVAGALSQNESALADLITNFNTTMAATASQSSALRATLRELPPTLRQADATFASLNQAFPPTRQFAVDVLPGVRETGPTINAALPWIEQARALFSKPELRGLASDLQPTTASLAKLTNETLTLLPQVDLASKCAADVVLPAGDIPVQDGALTTRGSDGKPVENFKEFWYAMVGLAGEGQNFDGNGQYVRFQVGGGSKTATMHSAAAPAKGSTYQSNPAVPPKGTSPLKVKAPPFRSDVPCFTQSLPDVNGPLAGPGPADGEAK